MEPKYELVDSRRSEFLRDIRKLEDSEKNQLFRGQASFKKFRLLEEDGAFYLGFYYGTELVAQPVRTFLSSRDERILLHGYTPLFALETQLRRVELKKASVPKLYTLAEILHRVIIDRVKQSINNKVGYVGQLKADIAAVMRFVERDEPNTYNARARMKSRIILVPSNGARKDGEGIPWGSEHTLNEHAFGDGLRPGVTPSLEALDILGKYFIVDPSSERGGQKGVFTCMDPFIQKLRKQEDIVGYEDIGCEERFNPGTNERVVETLYHSSANLVARLRGMNTGDGFLASEASRDLQYKDEDGDAIFDRFHNYLRASEKSLHKDHTLINLLVAFLPVDPESKKYDPEHPEIFFNTDKDVVSRSLMGADGCILASEQVTGIEMIRRRTWHRNMVKENFTSEFLAVKKRVEAGEEVVWENAHENPIGYYETCKDCNKVMVPGNLRTIFTCLACGNQTISDGQKLYLGYPGSVTIYQISAHQNIDFLEDDEAAPQDPGEEPGEEYETYDVYLKVADTISGSRVVGPEGIKGIMAAANQDYVGKVFIEELGKLLPLDALIPSNANKGADSGMMIAMARLGMVISSYEANEPESLIINHHLRDPAEATKYLKDNFNITKRKVFRAKYDHELKQIKYAEEDLWVGVVQIKVTEAGREFVKTRENETKFTFQLGNALQMLGKEAIAADLHRYSMGHNPESALKPETSQELVDILFESKHQVQEFGPDVLKDLNLAVKTVQSVLPLDKFQKLMTESSVFSDERFKNGFILNIPLADENLRVRFPSKSLIMRFANSTVDGEMWIPEFAASMFKIILALKSNRAKFDLVVAPGTSHEYKYLSDTGLSEQVRGNVFRYRKNITKLLVGKQGVLPKMLAYRGFSHGGKEFGCHLLPTGVAVINDRRTWDKMVANAKEMAPNWESDTPIYAFCIRDPFVWPLQGASAVEVWNPQKANAYFQKMYGIDYATFGDGAGDDSGKAYYRNPVGICLNVLDMLYLYQSDSDGDYRRLYIPFDIQAQVKMAEFNRQMRNYDFINPNKLSDTDPHASLIRSSWAWHHKYLFGFTEDGDFEEGEVNKDKHSKDDIRYQAKTWGKSFVSKQILDSVKKKGLIASVTTSLWKLVYTAEYLYRKGELSREERDKVIFLYQSEFLQDGCIRLLKYKNPLEAMTIDKIGKNDEIQMYDGKKVRAQHVIVESSDTDPQILEKFFTVCRQYVEFIGFRKDAKSGTYKFEPEADVSVGNLILAFTDFTNGSRAGMVGKNGGIDPDKVKDFLCALTTPDSNLISQKSLFWFIMPAIERNLSNQ